MHRIIDLDKRMEYIEQLGNIYCKDYVHNVKDDDECWGTYQVSLKYPKKIDCSPDPLLSKMRSFWPACNKIWPEFCENKKSGDFKFWEKMCLMYFVSHPYICELVKLLFNTSPENGHQEISYSKLAKLCYKDRNKRLSKNIEVQLNEYKLDYGTARLVMKKN